MFERALLITVGGLVNSLPGLAQAAEPMPPGIGIRMTLAGQAFVDARGMTLYQQSGSCPDSPERERVTGSEAVGGIPLRVPDADSRRSCTDKYPPLLAPPDAKPVGHWTIHLRENGARQWAYRGDPLHTSVKDKVPGETSAWDIMARRRWKIAVVPLAAPPGIETRLTSAGLALSNDQGKVLYFLTSGTRAAGSERWKPVLVPVAARSDNIPADWSIASIRGGLRQWAWRGKPLYTYAQDAGDELPPQISQRLFVDVFGDTYGKPVPGWQLALLKSTSAPPAGVRIVPTSFNGSATFLSSKIYANAQGKTLYVIQCIERTKDNLDCDDVGDSPRYWLSFCGGEERCARTWRPFVASKNAKPVDGLWSVSTVNPRHPYKPLQDGEEGRAVWTFGGLFVFTYAGDEKEGDIWGATAPDRQRMFVHPIPALSAL